MRIHRVLLTAYAAIASGCEVYLHGYDLNASAVGVVDTATIHSVAANFGTRPRFWAAVASDRGQVLRVRLTTSKDLWRRANTVSGVVHADWRFCDAPWQEANVGYPDVYVHGQRVPAIYRPRPSPVVIDSEGRFEYDAILYVRSVAESGQSYDLERDPRDVCVSVWMSDLARVLKTNIAKIPKEEIAGVLADAAHRAPSRQGSADEGEPTGPPTASSYRPEQLLRRHFPIVLERGRRSHRSRLRGLSADDGGSQRGL